MIKVRNADGVERKLTMIECRNPERKPTVIKVRNAETDDDQVPQCC